MLRARRRRAYRFMNDSVLRIINSYNPDAPLEAASTIPSSWYTDPRIFELEAQTVFSRSWQMAARGDQLNGSGSYATTEIAGEPIVVVRGSDDELRGFFNVCRHHAAAVMTEPEGRAHQLRCPYHGWTYSLEGELKGMPDFSGVCDFDRAANGLVPIQTAVFEKWVFARLGGKDGDSSVPLTDLAEFLGPNLIQQLRSFDFGKLHWFQRRSYELKCNWKVFVDNYLDGGYHVPFLHHGLDSVLDYSRYTIETGERFCLQSSPVVTSGAEAFTGAVRQGELARYYWVYPNFMINCYEGVMDTNLVLPLGVDRCEVIFDFYFTDLSEKACARNLASIAVSERIQEEDVSICKSVQRGLRSRSYQAGRLSVRREAGEYLFHRLLYADFQRIGL